MRKKKKGVSITIRLTDIDIDVTLDEFAKRLRDTADILNSLDRVRPSTEQDFLIGEGQMMIDFDRPVNPIKANVRVETEFGTTEGSSLIGGIVTKGNGASSVEIFKHGYDLIKSICPYPLTIREMAELNVLDSAAHVYRISDKVNNKETYEPLYERAHEIMAEVMKRNRQQ